MLNFRHNCWICRVSEQDALRDCSPYLKRSIPLPVAVRIWTKDYHSSSSMRPSFSPTRVTVDGGTGRQRFDNQDVVTVEHLPKKSTTPPSASRAERKPDPNEQMQQRTLAFMLQGALQAVLCGGIISVVLCPCMIGFATIIYSHPEFAPVMPMLIKLVFVSSVVHQVLISTRSPLPFAIAQVQDAGLIFSATMATSIMTELGDAVPLEERVATVVVHLSICTVLVGLGLILTGKARLASLVQYLPTPVIGGYLAYIGFFMINGGVSLMTTLSITGIRSWTHVFATQQYLLLALPGIVCGVLLSLITTKFRHFAVFPGCLIVIPIAFYLVLTLTGTSMDDARDAGFLAQEGPSVSLLNVYTLFDFERIHWRAMFPTQLPTLLSMFIMIAFASSLDIASLCMGTGATMNYNEQLQIVGISNLVSGLTGGYTGSYIFSQTMFSYRFHPSAHEEKYPGLSRLVGLSVVFCELGIVFTPVSLTTVIPKFLFGSVMIFIGIELLKTWLFGVYSKLLLPEYVTVVGTFCCLNVFGVQLGLGLGVALAALCFLVEYSKAQVVRIVQKSSNVIRNAEQHELLYLYAGGGGGGEQHHRHDTSLKQQAIVTIELQGHIFFGSATRIQNCVKRAVYVVSQSGSASPRNSRHARILNSNGESLPLLASTKFARYDPKAPKLVNLEGEEDACADGEKTTSEHRRPTRFVVFDFSQVSGLDATAARSCFLALKLLFSNHQITVVYCGMRADVEFLLRANDVLPPLTETPSHSNTECYVTSDLDLALDWCETQLILSAARKRSFESGLKLYCSPFESRQLSLQQIFLAYLTDARKQIVAPSHALEDLEEYFYIRAWQEDERIFDIDDDSDTWYVLLRGQVTLFTLGQETALESPSGRFRSLTSSTVLTSIISSGSSATKQGLPINTEPKRELVGRVRAGCIFGDLDYVLDQRRVIDATSTAADTVVAAITRTQMQTLAHTRLELAFVLQEILLRASYMTLAEKLHSIVV